MCVCGWVRVCVIVFSETTTFYYATIAYHVGLNYMTYNSQMIAFRVFCSNMLRYFLHSYNMVRSLEVYIHS